MEKLTREEYMRQRTINDMQMRDTKVRELDEIRKVNLHYEDLLHDAEVEFRRKRNEIIAERDSLREEQRNKFKDERRRIYDRDTLLVNLWRRQLMSENMEEEGGEA